MLKSMILLLVVAAVGIVLAPHLIPALTWVMAFASLLILGDLLLSGIRRYRARGRES